MDVHSTEDIETLSETLFEAPIARYSESGFIKNDYRSVEPKGVISLNKEDDGRSTGRRR